MKKLLLLSMLLMVAKTFSFAQSAGCEELFFSEYIDGPFKNKVLEIYNPTDSTISLAGYTIKIFQNGAPTPITIFLSGSIAPKGTYVVAHFQADSAVLSKADMVSPMMNFDGNDAIVLNRGQSTYVDKIGEIGVDPGNSGWFVPPNGSTKEHDLRRKLPVDRGQPDWVQGKTEWEVHPKDSVANIKKHKSVCAAPTVKFVGTTSSVSESIGTAYVVVELTGSNPDGVNIWIMANPYTGQCAANLATSNIDFAFPGAVIPFYAGETGKDSTSVGIIDDSSIEPSEAICFEFDTPTDAIIGNPNYHVMTIVDNDPQGINDIETKSIKIYPIIADEDIFIEGIRGSKDLLITVSNVLGQGIMSFSYDDNEELKIDVRNLEQGFYFLNIYGIENQVITKKFIKE